MAGDVKVHNVIDGPYEDEEEDGVWLVCLAEESGIMSEIEIYFDTFDDAYNFTKHFLTSIEPVILSQSNGDN